MRMDDYVEWFEEIEANFGRMETQEAFGGGLIYDQTQAFAWAAEAGAAISGVFPPAHHCRRQWDQLSNALMDPVRSGKVFEAMLGIFKAATRILREGRLAQLIASIRAETVDELLDQAAGLLGAGHHVAAAVVVGGALETHLGHPLAKHGLTVAGDGSISKYDGAIAKARNDGTTTVYSVTDGKLVTAWGGIRNEAAHTPAEFNRSVDEVRRMIAGIRELMARAS